MMRISSNEIAAFGISRRTSGRNSMQTDFMQMRLQEKKREMQIQEKENERIKLLTERITEANNSDMDWDLRRNVVESLSRQINQIYENRAERELMASEREMMRKKALLEETTQMREEPQDNMNVAKNRDPQENEETNERNMMMGLVRNGAARERINTLKQTRAALAAEAGLIRSAIHSENSNYVLIGSGGGEVIIGGQSGLGNSHDYRNQQLGKLKLGIARADASINQTISSMYRESAKMQEGWLAEHQEKSENEENDPDANFA